LLALERATFKLPERDQAAEMNKGYERSSGAAVTPSVLSNTEDADLAFIYKAAYLATFYTYDRAHLEDMRRTLAELEHRKTATDEQRTLFYRTMIGLRLFDDARLYLVTHPTLAVEPIPKIGLPANETSKLPATPPSRSWPRHEPHCCIPSALRILAPRNGNAGR
jgi:hypothetical protein